MNESGPAPCDEAICHTTSDGVTFFSLPFHPTKNAPLLVLLTMDGRNTLTQDPYRRVGVLLHEQGWNVASLDLPCHGADSRPGEPPQIQGWAARSQSGENWLDPFIGRVRSMLAFLIEQKIADPLRMAVAGTSRGGFLALQLAVHFPALRAVATFAPVTDLTALREFAPLCANPLVRAMNLEAAADRLCDRPVWIIIGHDDERVGTDRSVSLAGALERAAQARGLAPSVTLQVLPIPGHRSFPEWHDQAAEWFQKVVPANPRT